MNNRITLRHVTKLQRLMKSYQYHLGPPSEVSGKTEQPYP